MDLKLIFFVIIWVDYRLMDYDGGVPMFRVFLKKLGT